MIIIVGDILVFFWVRQSFVGIRINQKFCRTSIKSPVCLLSGKNKQCLPCLSYLDYFLLSIQFASVKRSPFFAKDRPMSTLNPAATNKRRLGVTTTSRSVSPLPNAQKEICAVTPHHYEISRREGISSKYEPSGGVLTSRLPSPVPIYSELKSLGRIQIRDEDFRPIPDFEGCPDWAKPLMLCEHQV